MKTFLVTVLAPSLEDILSSDPPRSVTDFPFHWQNVRPVLESAVEFFKLDELYDLEIELVPDGGALLGVEVHLEPSAEAPVPLAPP